MSNELQYLEYFLAGFVVCSVIGYAVWLWNALIF